jgi:hypothetical protein
MTGDLPEVLNSTSLFLCNLAVSVLSIHRIAYKPNANGIDNFWQFYRTDEV